MYSRLELWTVVRRTAGEGSEDHTAWVGVHPGQRLVNTPIVPGTVPLFLPQRTVLCKPLVRALIAEKPPQPIGYLGKPEGDSRLGSRAHPGLCRGSACLTSLNNCSQETVSYETGLRGCELSGSQLSGFQAGRGRRGEVENRISLQLLIKQAGGEEERGERERIELLSLIIKQERENILITEYKDCSSLSTLGGQKERKLFWKKFEKNREKIENRKKQKKQILFL